MLLVFIYATSNHLLKNMKDMSEDIQKSREYLSSANEKATFITNEKIRANTEIEGSIQGEIEAVDIQGAIEDCTEAIRLDPNYAEAYFKRGILKQYLGDEQGAKADFEKAKSL